MSSDGRADYQRRFERALEGLRAGPGERSETKALGAAQSGRSSAGYTVGPGLDAGRGFGHDQGIEMDDFVQDTADMERDLRRRSRLLPAGIALILLAAFGAVIWFAFAAPGISPDGQQTVELIQADPEPVKSKPEDPGGMKVDHQDKLILNPDPEKPQVERLLPPPEAPVPVTPAPESADVADAVEGVANSDNASSDNTDSTPVVVTEDAEAGSAALLEEGGKAAEEAAEAVGNAAASAGEAVSAAGSQLAEQAETAASQAIDKVESAVETAAKKLPQPAPKPVPAAKPAAPAAKEAVVTPKPVAQVAKVPTDSGYVLQLASLRSEQDALKEWGRIQGENKNLLAQMKPIVEKADIEGIGTRYRLQTGPFPTKATAQDLCAQLKAAKQDCLVKRR